MRTARDYQTVSCEIIVYTFPFSASVEARYRCVAINEQSSDLDNEISLMAESKRKRKDVITQE